MEPFDQIARTYDDEFTHSAIGKAQRSMVYANLKKCMPVFKEKRILELNCGTGADAYYFGKEGAVVLATDISREMITIAKKKTETLPNVGCSVLDINELEKIAGKHKFDLIFSNFGGINCLSKEQVISFFNTSQNLLNDNGLIILVIMADLCIWESAYFALKGRFKSVLRRKKKAPVRVTIGNSTVKTHYYSPKQMSDMAGMFKVKRLSPIGFFIPPSYLNKFFDRKKRILNSLEYLDRKIVGISTLSHLSDHFFICFEKNNN